MADVLDNTLRSWFRQFEKHRLSLASEHTVYQYALNLRRFEEFLNQSDDRKPGEPRLDDLRDENVMAAAGWLVKKCGLSIASASKLRDNLKTIWEYIARKGGVSVWPELPHIQEPETIPIALPVKKLLLVWEIAGRQPGEICGIPESLWWRSKLGTFWSSGERVGPFKLATWDEFDLEGGFWTVPPKHRKGGKRGIVHPLHYGAVQLLRELHGYQQPKVWPRDFCERSMYDRLGVIMQCAGLPNDRRHKFHIFRKSVATMVELFGGDSTEAMDWRDASMKRVYVDRTICPRDTAKNRLPWIGDMGDDPKPAA